jgi:DNA-binding CsgD family transcriptional regulator
LLARKLEASSLSARELEILELVANGFSAKEVAIRLGIAPATVERHTEHVRTKIRARNRPHMVALAISMGILMVETSELPAYPDPSVHGSDGGEDKVGPAG